MPHIKWDTNCWSLSEGKLAVLHASADESARHVRGLYFTFLLFAFYVAVIVFSTTDEQLLKETGARLPLLNVELPLLGFYIVVPWLVFIFHVHLMTQFFLLSRKLHNLNQAIVLLPEDIQRTHRELPFPLVFSHMIVGRHHLSLLRWAFSAAVIVTVVIVPIALLLTIQWKFLPYHSSWITRNHQIVFLFDILLLWALWPRMFAHSGRWRIRRPSRGLGWQAQRRWQMFLVFVVSASTMFGLIVSILLFVPPGSGIERFLGEQAWLDYTFHRNLDLREKTLMRQEPPPELIAAYKAAGDPPEKVWLDHGKPLDLQRRNLRNANFTRAILWDVDFRGAQLQGAYLGAAQLQGAYLRGAQLQGAYLESAQLQGADFRKAQLQGAYLEWAQLQGADFRKAQLQGVNLGAAQLQGADLQEAQLQGVNLGWTQLQSANLGLAELQGADLREAQLQGANLREAQLQGADLQEAQLQGANLREAQLQGADLRGTRVYATDFAEANLSMADIRGLVSAPVSWDGDSFETMEHLESTLTISVRNWPDNVRRHLQVALSHFWIIAFDPPLNKILLTPSQATGALYDHCELFADWPPPPDVGVFEKNHAAFLAKLSCSNEYVAKAIVARALPESLPPVFFGQIPLSKRSHTLAQVILNKVASKTCPKLADIIKENRKELERITQQTNMRLRNGGKDFLPN